MESIPLVLSSILQHPLWNKLTFEPGIPGNGSEKNNLSLTSFFSYQPKKGVFKRIEVDVDFIYVTDNLIKNYVPRMSSSVILKEQKPGQEATVLFFHIRVPCKQTERNF